MAHFAEIDDSNVVLRVVVLDNADCLDADGNESEAVGKAYLENSLGGTWLQTSYNTHHGAHDGGGSGFRKNYAAPGHTYDAVRNAFIPPKTTHPDSHVLDEDICQWVPPLARPDDWSNDAPVKNYYWDAAGYQADNTEGCGLYVPPGD